MTERHVGIERVFLKKKIWLDRLHMHDSFFHTDFYTWTYRVLYVGMNRSRRHRTYRYSHTCTSVFCSCTPMEAVTGMWRSIPWGSGVSDSLKSNKHTGSFKQAHNRKSSAEEAPRKHQSRLMTFWDCIELNRPFKRVTLLMRSSITTGSNEETSSWKVGQTVVKEAP